MSPKNIAEIARILLACRRRSRRGGRRLWQQRCTTLGLVATSAPPAVAGVQLDGDRRAARARRPHGSSRDRRPRQHADPRLPGQRPAGRGRISGEPRRAARSCRERLVWDVSTSMDAVLRRARRACTRARRTAQMIEASPWPASTAAPPVVEFLLDHGVDVDAELRVTARVTLACTSPRITHTSRWWSTAAATRRARRCDRQDVGDAAVDLGADRVEERLGDEGRALLRGRARGWFRRARTVTPDLLEWDRARADPRMLAALTGTI